MAQPSQAALALAERLIRIETGADVRGGAGASLPAQRVLERLGLHLSPLVGVVGMQALLARSLALASVEADWLTAVKVTAVGVPTTFEDAARGRTPDEVLQGSLAVVAHLLGLLVAFIGEDLTYRLTAKAWSDPTINDLPSSAREPAE